jgi:TolB-like protein/Tfp pilus assembly protein PilF
MSVVAELQRRNVFRVAAAYLVVGWLLTEVLTTILPTLGAPDWTSRAVILIFAIGFIPAVVLSWFFEITPEGIKRDDEVEREDGERPKIARRLDQATVVVAVILIVVVGLFSARYTADDPSPADFVAQHASVAVLPFVNMSSDADNEYFSDGLTETLLHMLAQIPDLKVAARTSSFAFKGQNTSIQDIARSLEVAHILEGSVQRVGDRVRITAQLIRASDGFHVWSQVYDRTLDDIFGIQDEIAAEVGTALSASLLGTEDPETRLAGVATSDPDAYDLYLQARKQQATNSYGGLQAAEDLLKGALLIDPGFNDAKTELATNYLRQMETGLIDQSTALAEAIAIADQVLATQEDNPRARATSLYAKGMSLASQGDISAIPALADELKEICLDSPEELDGLILLVRTNTLLKRDEDSVPLLEKALKADPFNPALHYELGWTYLRLERWDDARVALERSLEIEPAQPNALTFLGGIALKQGDAVGYVRQMLKAIAVDPKDHELPGLTAAFLYRFEMIEEADEFRNRVLTLAPLSEVAYQIEMLRARSIGDLETSIDAARRAVEDDIDDRRFAFGGAVQHLLRTAVRQGRLEEELAWLEQQSPGILDVDAARVLPKYRTSQGVAFDALYTLLPDEELQRRLEVLLAAARVSGVDPLTNPDTRMSIFALRGETEEAIRVAIEEFFTQPVTTHPYWQEMLEQPMFATMVADPRVAEAMQRWQDEEAATRDSLQAFFADLNASS